MFLLILDKEYYLTINKYFYETKNLIMWKQSLSKITKINMLITEFLTTLKKDNFLR